MNRTEALAYIIEQARQGELIFPTNVQASIKIRQALDAPDCSVEHAAQLLITEPLLAARLVAIANSVAYSRFGGGVTNVRTAISILGFSSLRAIVTSVVIRQLSQSITDPALSAKANQLWEHTVRVAAIAHLAARKISHVEFETAMFAGIVHAVGGFYLLSRAQEFPALLEPTSAESDASAAPSGLADAVIGQAVLKKLMVPKIIINAVEFLWAGVPEIPPTSLGGTLMLAKQLAKVRSPLENHNPANGNTDELDFAVGDDTLKNIMHASQAEIDSLTSVLLS